MANWWRRLLGSPAWANSDGFHRLTQNVGGEVEAQRVGAYAIQIKGWCEEFLRRPLDQDPQNDGRLKAVYQSVSVRYVSNTGFNAIACGSGKLNYAGIYGGVPARLAALALSTLRTESVWPELSNPGTKEDPADAALLKEVYQMGSARADSTPRLQERHFQPPPHSQRHRIANDLFILMSYFLFFHELGHIARGHLDFLARQGRPMAIFEATGASGSSDWRTSQWLELDADRFGLTLLLSVFDWDQPWLEARVPAFDSRDRYGPLEALRLCYLALGLTFSIFDYREEVITDHHHRTHPHPAVRLAHSIGQASQFLMQYHHAPEDQCSAIAGQALLDVDRVGRVIGRNLASYSAEDPAAVGHELKSILEVLTEPDLEPSWTALHRRIGYPSG